jgi:hypothetical protein
VRVEIQREEHPARGPTGVASLCSGTAHTEQLTAICRNREVICP